MRSEYAEWAARQSAGGIVDPSTLAAALRDYASSRPEIQSIWLFGSQAQGVARSTSDLDLALQVWPAPSVVAEIEYRAERAREIETLLGIPVDVVLLSAALPLPLLWGILRTPRVVYEKHPGQAACTGTFLRGLCRDQWPRIERRWERTERWLNGVAGDEATGRS